MMCSTANNISILAKMPLLQSPGGCNALTSIQQTVQDPCISVIMCIRHCLFCFKASQLETLKRLLAIILMNLWS